MPSTITQTPLAANLAALGDRNADVADLVRNADAPPTLAFTTSRQGDVTATLGGGALASRHDPRNEARRLADTVDVLQHAVVVVLGFGLGYHVEALARTLGRTGLIVVYEPDVGVLRGVLDRIDHSGWLRDALIVIVNDPEDRGALARRLGGAESILAQGVTFLEHPASRERLAPGSKTFRSRLTDYVTTVKTTFMTTLVRASDTVGNMLRNVDHYAGGSGVAELAGTARDRLAVVVSAGPSLQRNLHLLTEPGVRDRCVIVAVQTTLKPLLDAGVRPHFVTALDYHEISRRFYDGLSPEDVEGTTLIVEPKAHPAILDAFPGPIRCCEAPFLDRLLGETPGARGRLEAGATVAHLAVYVARHLGCNPIAVIGQDLGFPDGLYYAPGTAIHDVWAPELNPFNTIAMMEWQRIARHRPHLHRTEDVFGRPLYTDAQMLTYLHQFERDFAQFREEGIRIIDATEGGLPKQHTERMPLAEALERFARGPRPAFPKPDATPPQERLRAASRRLATFRRDVLTLRRIARKTTTILRRMLDDPSDAERMRSDFDEIERHRKQVAARMDSFDLLNQINQLGVFKRVRADRRLQLQEKLAPADRQRAQLERDLVNVTWIADASREMVALLRDGERRLRGDEGPRRRRAGEGRAVRVTGAARIAALVPVDPVRNGVGAPRSLRTAIAGRTVLQRTLERLGRSRTLDSIILLAPDDMDVEGLLRRDAIGAEVTVERVGGSPFGDEQPAVAAARRFADTCWRGGIGGMSVYDEVLCPTTMLPVMKRHDLAAAVLVGPDWPLVDVTAETGVDAIVTRFLEHRDLHEIVFTQAPPGLGACLVNARLMTDLAVRSRISTIGALLSYQPHAPKGDPIATRSNVQIDHDVRHALIRATYDTPRHRDVIDRAIGDRGLDGMTTAELVAAIDRATVAADARRPRHVRLELVGPDASSAMPFDVATGLLDALSSWDDVTLTLTGRGDPLGHGDLARIIRYAVEARIGPVHVRTRLRADRDTLDRLLASGVEVVSVALDADTAETYARVTGADRFHDVLANIQHLVENRRYLTGPPGGRGLALPWIVPHIERRVESCAEIDGFYDRWQRLLGVAVIDAPPPPATHPGAAASDTIVAAVTPAAVARRTILSRMTIRCDGSIPLSEVGADRGPAVRTDASGDLDAAWSRLVARRLELIEKRGIEPMELCL